jgi:hypothetical protein
MTANPTPLDGKAILDGLVAGLEGVTRGPWHGSATELYGNVYDHDNSWESIAKPANIRDTAWKTNCSHIAKCDPDSIRAIAAYVAGLENSLKTEREYSKKLSVLMAKIAAEEAEYDED